MESYLEIFRWNFYISLRKFIKYPPIVHFIRIDGWRRPVSACKRWGLCYLVYDLLPPYLEGNYLPLACLKGYDEDKFQVRSNFLLNYKRLPHSTNASVIHILLFSADSHKVHLYQNSLLLWLLSMLYNSWNPDVAMFFFDKQFFFCRVVYRS